MTQVDMLAPIELQDTVFSPRVVGIGDGARRLITAGRHRVGDCSDGHQGHQHTEDHKEGGHNAGSSTVRRAEWLMVTVLPFQKPVYCHST